MSGETRKTQVGPVVRCLAGLMCPACVVIAILVLFSGDYPYAVIFAWFAVLFGIIAATGFRRPVQAELLAAAREYASGEITLEEYGSVTKELLQKH